MFAHNRRKYAFALVGAGVFNDSRPMPKLLHRRTENTTQAISQPKSSVPDVPESVTVSIKADGEIDTTMDVSDVAKTLGISDMEWVG